MSTIEYVPGLAGVPAAESAVSYIDGEKGILEYRGYPIQELAEKSSFEETTYLLLFGKLPSREELEAFSAELVPRRRVKFHLSEVVKRLPEGAHPMNALQASVAALGALYPAHDVTDPQIQRDTVVSLIAKFPTLVAMFYRIREGMEPVAPREDLSHAANFLYMLSGKEPDPIAERTMDAALIIHADHTFNASTFTARVVASTLADGYSVMASAVASLSGPLHGGANEAVLELLETIPTPEDARGFLEAKLAAKEKVMGLGHRVYKIKDPRAFILQRLGEQLMDKLGTSPYYDRAKALEVAAAELLGPKGIYPNVDFYSGIVYDRMGIPRDLFTPIFAVSRISGWCAHWLEQLADNRIFRPKQIFVGDRNLEYVPLNQRD